MKPLIPAILSAFVAVSAHAAEPIVIADANPTPADANALAGRARMPNVVRFIVLTPVLDLDVTCSDHPEQDLRRARAAKGHQDRQRQ